MHNILWLIWGPFHLSAVGASFASDLQYNKQQKTAEQQRDLLIMAREDRMRMKAEGSF